MFDDCCGCCVEFAQKTSKNIKCRYRKRRASNPVGMGFPSLVSPIRAGNAGSAALTLQKRSHIATRGRRSFFTTQKGASKSIYSVLIPREEPINYPFFSHTHCRNGNSEVDAPMGRFLPVCCTAAGMDRVQDTCHEKETLFDKPLIWLMFLVPSGYD